MQPHSWAIVLPTARECLQALSFLDASQLLTIGSDTPPSDTSLQPPVSLTCKRFHLVPPLSIRKSPAGSPEIRGSRCSRCRQADHQRSQCPGILTCVASLRHIKSDAIRGDILDLLTATISDAAPAHHWVRVSPSFSPEGRLLPNLILHFANERDMTATLAQQLIQVFLPRGITDPSILYPTDPSEAPHLVVPLYHIAGCLNCGDPHWHPLSQCPCESRRPNPAPRPAPTHSNPATPMPRQGPPAPPPQASPQPSSQPPPVSPMGSSRPSTLTQQARPSDHISIPQRLPQETPNMPAVSPPPAEDDQFTPVTTRQTKRPNLRPTPEGVKNLPTAPTNRFTSLIGLPDSTEGPPLNTTDTGPTNSSTALSSMMWADDLPSSVPTHPTLCGPPNDPPTQ